MNKYKFNKRKRQITEIATGKILQYFPPIGHLAGEVVLIDGDYAEVVWGRENYLNKDRTYNEKAAGCCEWDDLQYDERLEYLFNL